MKKQNKGGWKIKAPTPGDRLPVWLLLSQRLGRGNQPEKPRGRGVRACQPHGRNDVACCPWALPRGTPRQLARRADSGGLYSCFRSLLVQRAGCPVGAGGPRRPQARDHVPPRLPASVSRADRQPQLLSSASGIAEATGPTGRSPHHGCSKDPAAGPFCRGLRTPSALCSAPSRPPAQGRRL